MEWVILALVLALATALTGLAWLRLRARNRAAAALPLDPADLAELDALGRLLAAEHHRWIWGQLARRLDQLRDRRVPLVRVRGVPGVPGQVVLEFADGTVLDARSPSPKDAVAVALALHRERVLLTLWDDSGSSFPVRLSWRSGERVLDAVALRSG